MIATEEAVDNYLSNLASLTQAITQRTLTAEQLDRLAAILLVAEVFLGSQARPIVRPERVMAEGPGPYAWLHDLGCDGERCRCARIYRVTAQ